MPASHRFSASALLLVACLGSAGCSATHDGDHATNSRIELVAQVMGDSVYIHGSTRIDLYSEGCRSAEFEKWSDGQWAAWRDDRPARDLKPGYYLDGEFVWAATITPCKYACEHHQGFQPPRSLLLSHSVFKAYEYVKVGTQAPPSGVGGAASEVDMIELQPVSGRVRFTYEYFTDAKCQTPSATTSVEFTIPPESFVDAGTGT